MAATLHRNTQVSGLKPPASQVTAPVLEFRCMFTHDILKKQKKWHDGSLRFHTFNKRVMVYDESKNLVGDLHYRQAEEFGEGLELKLDRPVLVQVEEPLGQTNTDLTPLLTRQRQDTTPDSHRLSQPARATLPHSNPANSQLKPKSIKELLGASQARRVGRARLPLQSPYEQRQALVESQSITEPPAKRQKREAEKENYPLSTSHAPAASPPPSNIIAKQPSVQDRSAGIVVDLSSDDEEPVSIPRKERPPAVRELKSNKSKPSPSSHQNKKNKRPLPNVQDASSSSPSVSKTQQEVSSNAQHELVLSKSTPVLPVLRRPSTNTSRNTQSSSNFGPRSTLKFAPEKSRPRLMYKSLLSNTQGTVEKSKRRLQSEPSVGDLSSAKVCEHNSTEEYGINAIHQIVLSSPVSSNNANEEISDLRKSPADPTLSHELDEAHNNLLDHDAVSQNPKELHCFGKTNEDSEDVSASPLFMPRTASQESPFPTQEFPAHNTDLGALSQFHRLNDGNGDGQLNQVVNAVPTSQPEDQSQQDVCNLTSSPDFMAARQRRYSVGKRDIGQSNPPESTSSASIPKAPIAPPLSDSPLSRLKSRRPSREFRRVLSENYDGNAPSYEAQIHYPSGDRDNVSGVSGVSTSIANTTNQQSDTSAALPLKLRTSTSDPSALYHPVTSLSLPSSSPFEDAPQHQSEPILKANEVTVKDTPTLPLHDTSSTVETGPWTSDEAYLLFDWWPSERKKPDYGQDMLQTATGDSEWTMRGGTAHGIQKASMNAMSKMKYGMFGSARLVSQQGR